MHVRPVLVAGLACWAATTAAAFAVRTPGTDASGQRLDAAIPAAGLTHLHLAGLDGRVDLRASPDPSSERIDVSVAVEPAGVGQWICKPSPSLPPLSLVTDVTGHELDLDLRGTTAGAADATWTVTAPARFSARVDLHNGRVSVTGLTGGVQVAVNSGMYGRPGEIRADVPGGGLDLDLGVGTIDARTSAARFGAVDLHAVVGNARLFFDGHEVMGPGGAGPGRRLRMDGDRTGALSLSVTVGDARLSIR